MSDADSPRSLPPRLELHVHLEGTVAPATLLRIARRNGVALPATTGAELAALYRFTDFTHFIRTWVLVTAALQRADDFREITVAYAEEAVRHGAVYLEAIISPAEAVRRGSSWEEVLDGYADGIAEAMERTGVDVRLTPDIPRGFTLEEAEETVRWTARYRDRGMVGVGLGGLEADFPPEPYAPAFALARDLGLGSVPHAGEVAGPASIRGALDALGADRIRHGIRALEDPALVAELAARGTVLDVCLTSNVRTGAVASLDAHPLPRLVAAGVRCSLSTDDPAMFGTDLAREHAAAAALGVPERTLFDAGLAGALCDEATRARLAALGDRYWGGPGS